MMILRYIKAIIRMIKTGLRDALLSDPIFAVTFYRKKGVIIGDDVKLYNVSFDSRRPFLISIGDNCILTNCRILTHDASMFLSTGHTKIGRVSIGNNVFVGAGSIVLPGVHIGDNVVIGAGAVVAKDIPSGWIVAGNPAHRISDYDTFVKKNMDHIKMSEVFFSGDEKREEIRTQMIDALSNKCAYAKQREDKGK